MLWWMRARCLAFESTMCSSSVALCTVSMPDRFPLFARSDLTFHDGYEVSDSRREYVSYEHYKVHFTLGGTIFSYRSPPSGLRAIPQEIASLHTPIVLASSQLVAAGSFVLANLVPSSRSEVQLPMCQLGTVRSSYISDKSSTHSPILPFHTPGACHSGQILSSPRVLVLHPQIRFRNFPPPLPAHRLADGQLLDSSALISLVFIPPPPGRTRGRSLRSTFPPLGLIGALIYIVP